MKRKESRKGPPLRKLTKEEQAEETLYRSQLMRNWSFRPGEHPVDVYRRKQQGEDL